MQERELTSAVTIVCPLCVDPTAAGTNGHLDPHQSGKGHDYQNRDFKLIIDQKPTPLTVHLVAATEEEEGGLDCRHFAGTSRHHLYIDSQCNGPEHSSTMPSNCTNPIGGVRRDVNDFGNYCVALFNHAQYIRRPDQDANYVFMQSIPPRVLSFRGGVGTFYRSLRDHDVWKWTPVCAVIDWLIDLIWFFSLKNVSLFAFSQNRLKSRLRVVWKRICLVLVSFLLLSSGWRIWKTFIIRYVVVFWNRTDVIGQNMSIERGNLKI